MINDNIRPINQAIVAALVLIYFLTLVFPFEELFGGAAPSQQSKKLLSEVQIAQARDNYRSELYARILEDNEKVAQGESSEKPQPSGKPIPKGAKKEKVSLPTIPPKTVES